MTPSHMNAWTQTWRIVDGKLAPQPAAAPPPPPPAQPTAPAASLPSHYRAAIVAAACLLALVALFAAIAARAVPPALDRSLAVPDASQIVQPPQPLAQEPSAPPVVDEAAPLRMPVTCGGWTYYIDSAREWHAVIDAGSPQWRATCAVPREWTEAVQAAWWQAAEKEAKRWSD